MKTIPLRQLVRAPLTVKRWTRAGQTVQVTDRGEPLWTIRAAHGGAEGGREIEDLLDEMLNDPPSPIALSKLIKDSRR